ncbi:MAG: RusA family crossover junction endodeoxyribonuclease [Chloroflexi bacterium]|nr:RusA family crossover junction endodeoxyribonuclease [Chloroflexota bacterium]
MKRPVSIDVFIEGVPYCQDKAKGNKDAAQRWTEAVRQQTSNLPRMKSACRAQVEFDLPADKYPTDHPNGPDLDNLLKRLFDALNSTVFSEAQGKDGCVVKLTARKRRVSETKPTGARIRLRQLDS